MKEKQKQSFEAYKNYCKQNNISPCRVESIEDYMKGRRDS